MRRERILLLLVVLACALVWWGALASRSGLTLTFLDVGQGDAILIRAHPGRAVLVDGGGSTAEERYQIGRRVVVPSLLVMGVRRLQAVVVTHPDDDHCGGLSAVIEEVPTDQLLVPALRSPAGTGWDRLMLTARERQVPVHRIREGMWLNLGQGIACQVLGPPRHPFAGTASDDNNNSVVLRLRFGDFSALLTGDIEASAAERLVRRRAPLRCTVLKVPHHGSDSSFSESFLRAARPEVAVISVGRNNPFGHPGKRTTGELARQRAALYRTDLQGAVSVTSDGHSYRVRVAGVR